MTSRTIAASAPQRGTGLVETLVGLAIGLLTLVAIFQVYAVSESHKRTIATGSDAQQSASFALFLIARDVANAGNGVASAAVTVDGRTVLDGCALLRSIPILIEAGARAVDPDAITVFYGASSSLATPVALAANAEVRSLASADRYVISAPAAFGPNDVIAAVDGATCTLSTIDPAGVEVSGAGLATLAHTPLSGALGFVYSAGSAFLVNLGRAARLARLRYSVDTSSRALRTQHQLPTAGPVNPILGDIVNLKAQYGLDTDADGTVDTWQAATGTVWSSASLPSQPLATIRQIQSVRVAIVARSPQYEREAVTPGPVLLFDGTIAIALSADQQHYRYRVVETIVPLRNTLWNAT